MNESAQLKRGQEHGTRRKWLLGLGVLLMILGLAGVTVSTVMELTSVLLLGPLLLAGAAIQVVIGLCSEDRKEGWLHFLASAAEAGLGLFFLATPLHRVVSLVGLVAIWFLISGLIRLAISLGSVSRGRTWALGAALVALTLGVGVWIGWPVARLWFVGLCIGVDFICHGASWSALALTGKEAGPGSPAGAANAP
jgi:uncharacterized membrane protein HdeD (DUF308 family)